MFAFGAPGCSPVGCCASLFAFGASGPFGVLVASPPFGVFVSAPPSLSPLVVPVGLSPGASAFAVGFAFGAPTGVSPVSAFAASDLSGLPVAPDVAPDGSLSFSIGFVGVPSAFSIGVVPAASALSAFASVPSAFASDFAAASLPSASLVPSVLGATGPSPSSVSTVG